MRVARIRSYSGVLTSSTPTVRQSLPLRFPPRAQFTVEPQLLSQQTLLQVLGQHGADASRGFYNSNCHILINSTYDFTYKLVAFSSALKLSPFSTSLADTRSWSQATRKARPSFGIYNAWRILVPEKMALRAQKVYHQLYLGTCEKEALHPLHHLLSALARVTLRPNSRS